MAECMTMIAPDSHLFWKYGNYIAVGLLIRAVMNHIPPPALGFKNFEQVANNHKCDRSVKSALDNLQNSAKKLFEIIAHEQISKKEPRNISGEDVDCRQLLKLLLDEM